MKSVRELLSHHYRLMIIALLAFPALLIVIRGWNGFAYPSPIAQFSDLTLSHHTFIAYIRQQLFENHIFPMWFPTILSGTPLVANPLAGIWYPFGWPVFALPLPIAYNLLVGLHLSWGALGMYLLLRQQKFGMAASIFGGLAFGLMPKLFAHYGAGHLTLLYAVPWTPWLLLSTRLDNKYRPLLSAMILALIFLADVRWAAYAGIIWIFWLVIRTNHAVRVNLRLKIRYILILIPLAALLSACLAIPLAEYSSLSTRANLTGEEILQYSLTFPGLLGIFYPPLQGGTHESIQYFGSIILLLSLLALFLIRANRHVQFWSVIALGSLIYSLGSNFAFLKIIAYLPVFNLLRVPTRALFLLGMALAVLAATTIDQAERFRSAPYRQRGNLLIIGSSGFVIFLTITIFIFTDPEGIRSYLWGTCALLVSAAIVWLWFNQKINYKVFVGGIFILLILDTGLAGQTTLAYRSRESVWAEDERLALFLAKDTDQFRIYSPSFSLLQHVAGSYGLELAEGVDPLQLASYVDFMKSATGIPWQGYRVIVPGIAPGEDESIYTPDPIKLGLLNVKYILADFDLPEVDNLSLVEQINETRIYKNLAAKPRAWVVKEETGGKRTEYSIEQINWTPNRITIDAQGPGQLFLSEILYPGWQVFVNGESVDLQSDGILRNVRLYKSQNEVVFVFRPIHFYLGVTISLATWIVLMLFLFITKKFRNVITS